MPFSIKLMLAAVSESFAKMGNIIYFLLLVISTVLGLSNFNDEFDKDLDIQEALIGIAKRLPRTCPIVLLHDEQMPVYSVSYNLLRRLQHRPRVFLVFDFSTDNLENLKIAYNSNSTDVAELIHDILYRLYRQSRCYTFFVYLKDPRVLYSDKAQHHPGYRQNDHVVIVAYHITKRYKAFINLRIWKQIPNVIALKRNKYELEGVAIHIFTVIPYYRNGQRKSQEIDVWLVDQKMFWKNNSLFFEKFANFNNASLKLGISWKEPFLIWGNSKDPWLDGLDWRLFQLCKKALNFTFINDVVHVKSIGRKNNEDNKWTGMLGLLQKGEIDVGIGGISVTADRRRYFDFCKTYYTDSYNFIAPLNLKINTALDAFLQPLSGEVWMTTFFSMLIGIFTLSIVAKVESRLLQNDSDSNFKSLSNNLGFVVTIFCQKPYRHLPKASGVQSVYLGMTITIFLLGMAFSSCLISVLLGFKAQPLADNVEDILPTNLPIAIRNYDGRLNDYMNSSNLPAILEIFQKAKLVDYFESVDAIDEVVKGNMIYIDSKAKIQFTGRYRYAVGPKQLKFHVSFDNILEFDNLGWPAQQKWPFMKKFNKIISLAVEGGIVNHWMSQFKRGRFGESSEAFKIDTSLLGDKIEGVPEIEIPLIEGKRFVPLTNSLLSGVYALLIAGIVLSILVFISECLFEITHRIILKKKRSIICKLKSEGGKLSSPKLMPKIKQPKKQKHDANPKTKNKFPDLVWNDFEGINAKI